MNTVTALLLVLVAAVCADVVVDSAMIKSINEANAGWTAGENHLTSLSVEEAKAMLGALPSRLSTVPVVTREIRPSVELPTEFNSFESFPTLKPVIKNQEKCGSCWAFSATSALGYRFNIEGAKNSTLVDLSLAPQDPVSCDSGNMGCQGGFLPAVWSYMANTGVRTEACMPYTSGAGDNGTCPAAGTCTQAGANPTPFFAKNYFHVGSSFGTDAIRQELVKNGPVQAAFTVYSDFMSYKGGIYKHTSGQELGGHAITIIGYGEDNGEAYWIVQNSWGTGWGISVSGQGGFFKIAVDQCGISDQVYAGYARV